MHTNEPHDPLAELGYEQRDLHTKNIFKVTMFFFGFAFVSYLAGWLILTNMTDYKAVPGVNDLKSTKIPSAPNPTLQTNVTAKTDIKDMRRKEEGALNTSGDSEFVEGAQRIPIEQAIKLSAERGARLAAKGAGG